MSLPPEDLLLFYKLHQSLLFFVNQRQKIIEKTLAGPEEFATQPAEERLKVRDALLERMDLIDAFVTENPFGLPSDQREIIVSWNDLVAGQFFILRYLKKHTIFLSTKEPAIAYGVLALMDPCEDLLGPYLPRLCKTVLLPFKHRIVYDGILSGHNITFGAGIRRSLTDSYNRAKLRQGIITSLPVTSSR